jgi:hypothetical protein
MLDGVTVNIERAIAAAIQVVLASFDPLSGARFAKLQPADFIPDSSSSLL